MRRERPAVVEQSALYEGRVTHVRRKEVSHRFSSKLALCYIDLDELEAVLAQHPLWSERRWHPVQFRRSDYSGEATVPLGESIRATAGEGAAENPGPVRFLAQLRTWGWCFNPLTLAFCFGPDGDELRAVVATVTNTPWGERHDYVLPVGEDGGVDHRVKKAMHVSPFFPMQQTYRFRLAPPGPELRVAVEVEEEGEVVLRADMALRRRPLDRGAMTGLVLSRPPMTWRVSAGIYGQAARLARKGAHFHPHPAKEVCS